jgi:hypothetical protein
MAESLDRLAWLIEEHRKPPGAAAVDCVAHSEGQRCCIEALTDDTVWQALTAESRRAGGGGDG